MNRERPLYFGLSALLLVTLLALVSVLLLLDMDYDVLPLLQIPDPAGLLRPVLLAIAVLCGAWIAMHFFGRIFERVVLDNVGSHAHARSIWRVVSYVIWGVVLLALGLGLMGDVTSTALSVGLVGAALAFVLQKPLLNIAGWAVITYRRMYRIGDRVSVGGTQGYVTDVQVMFTEVREFGEWMGGDTFTGRIVNVPNALVFDGPVHNYTLDAPFVWDEVVNMVTYESDVDVAKAYMRESAGEVVGELMAKNYEEYRSRLEIRDLDMLLIREPDVMMDFTGSGVNLAVLYFCPAEHRRKVKARIVESIWRKFMGDPRVQIAYPHLQIVRQEAVGGEDAAESAMARRSVPASDL